MKCQKGNLSVQLPLEGMNFKTLKESSSITGLPFIRYVEFRLEFGAQPVMSILCRKQEFLIFSNGSNLFTLT